MNQRTILTDTVLLFFIPLFLGLILQSCTDTAPLKSSLKITFGGEGFYSVEMDGYGVAHKNHWPINPQLPYLSPALPEYYLSNGSPVAYIRESKPEATIQTQLKKEITGIGSITGKSKHLNFKGDVKVRNGSISAKVIADERLPNYVEKWDDETISWTLQIDNKTLKLGDTINSMYIMLDEPKYPLLHTPLHIASSAAQGLTDSTEVIKRIWDHFEKQKVVRVRDKKPLKYYGFHENKAPAELRRMLVSGTGQCVAWSYLFYATLGSQGIESEITLVVPPQKGRIFVKNWDFIEGKKFIHTGKNGVSESVAEGDDIQIIKKGNGRPFSKVWTADAIKDSTLAGDDKSTYDVGKNGIVDAKIDHQKAVPTIPYKFGLPNQRAYVLKDAKYKGDINLRGDDIITKQLRTFYVLTGSNGILETPWQEQFKEISNSNEPLSTISWVPEVGVGATHINFSFAIPKPVDIQNVEGDDTKKMWWIESGENGISDTPDKNYGHGVAYSVGIGAGSNGTIDSKPGGDDSIIDLSTYIEKAPSGYQYIHYFNMWPKKGVRGQHNETPPPDYPNHVIVKVRERYYDPSYGTGPFNSSLAWEKASLEGVGIRMKDQDGDFVRFKNKILFLVKPVQGDTALTHFIDMLPPI